MTLECLSEATGRPLEEVARHIKLLAKKFGITPAEMLAKIEADVYAEIELALKELTDDDGPRLNQSEPAETN